MSKIHFPFQVKKVLIFFFFLYIITIINSQYSYQNKHFLSNLNSNIQCPKINYNYLVFFKNGLVQLLTDSYQVIWSNQIGVLERKPQINIKKVDFSTLNILPSIYNTLYLINTIKENYTKYSLNIDEIVNLSPFFPAELNNEYYFLGDKKKSSFFLNIHTGDIIDDNNNNNLDIINTIHSNESIDKKYKKISMEEYYLRLAQRWENYVLWGLKKIYLKTENDYEEQNINFSDKYEKYRMNDENVHSVLIYFSDYDYIYNTNYTYVDNNFKYNSLKTTKKTSKKYFTDYFNLICFASTVLFLVFSWVWEHCSHKVKIETNTTDSPKRNENNIDNVSPTSTKANSNSEEEEEIHTHIIDEKKNELIFELKNNKDKYEKKSKMPRSKSMSFPNVITEGKKSPHKISAPEISFPPNTEFIKEKILFEPVNQVKSFEDTLKENEEEYLSHSKPFQFKSRKGSNLSNDNVTEKFINLKYKPKNYETSFIKELLSEFDNDKTIQETEDSNLEDKFTIEEENTEIPGRFKKEFDHIQLLNHKGYSTVFKCRHKIDQCPYIIKVFKVMMLKKDEDISKFRIIQELKNMMKLEHKNLSRYITCWFELKNYYSNRKTSSSNLVNIKNINGNEEEKSTTKKTKEKFPLFFFVQTEFHSTINLRQFLNKRTTKSSKELIYRIFRQIFIAVEYMHNKEMIHKDLKPTNIFLNEKFKIKIGDFGLNYDFEEEGKQQKDENNLYLPKDLLERRKQNDKKDDIYSLGVTLFEMCNIFKNERERVAILKEIQNEKYIETEDKCEYYSEFIELCKKMTKKKEEERLDIQKTILEFNKIFQYHRNQTSTEQ